MLPDPVHHDPGGKWIRPAREPRGHPQPSAPPVRGKWLRIRSYFHEALRNASWYLGSQAAVVPANMYFYIARLIVIRDHSERRRRYLRLQIAQPANEFIELGGLLNGFRWRVDIRQDLCR